MNPVQDDIEDTTTARIFDFFGQLNATKDSQVVSMKPVQEYPRVIRDVSLTRYTGAFYICQRMFNNSEIVVNCEDIDDTALGQT